MLEQFLADERGAAYAETLVALPVVLFGFLAVFQFAYLCAADLIVHRAASAAARAAVVFLPDDPQFYERAVGREAYVTEAARRVLLASSQFAPGTLKVTIAGKRGGVSTITASVQTLFDCSMFLGGIVCGADRQIALQAEAKLPYQQPGGKP